MDKIICVGKNYAEHARELGDPSDEKPVLFLKPPSVALFAEKPGQSISASIVDGRGALHHECEIVLKLGDVEPHMNEERAQLAIKAVTLGLDMTLRELQTGLKKAGQPWELSKVFAHSAIVGPWIETADIHVFKDMMEEVFTFSLDGRIRQRGSARDMILSPARCVAYASEYFPLCPGDLLFTGTPSGVGPVGAGQKGELAWGSRLSYGVCWG